MLYENLCYADTKENQTQNTCYYAGWSAIAFKRFYSRIAYDLCTSHLLPRPSPFRGELRRLCLLVQQISAKSPTLRRLLIGKTTAVFRQTLRGLLIGKTTAVFPCSLLTFHFTMFFVYIKQTPGISPALLWQHFGQSPAHFHGNPPPWGCGFIVIFKM